MRKSILISVSLILIISSFFMGAWFQENNKEKMFGRPAPEWYEAQEPTLNYEYNFSTEWVKRNSFIEINKIVFPEIVGGNRTTHTYSMKPVINDGDILIKTTDFIKDDLKVGNIIIFDNGQMDFPFIHRIVRITPLENGRTCYFTKGDNNKDYDTSLGCIDEEDIEALVLGVLWK